MPSLDLKLLAFNIEELYINGYYNLSLNDTFLHAVAKTLGNQLRVFNIRLIKTLLCVFMYSRSRIVFTRDSIVDAISKMPNLTHLDISETYNSYQINELQTMLMDKEKLVYLGVRGKENRERADEKDIHDVQTRHGATIQKLRNNNPEIVIEQ